MPFEGYPNHFLKLILEVEEGEGEERRTVKTNATGKDYYGILGLTAEGPGGLLGKEVTSTKTTTREKLEKTITHNDEGYELDERNINEYLTKLRREGKDVKRFGNQIIEKYWLEKTENVRNDVYTNISSVYRKNSLKYHPDKGIIRDAETFQKINEAYQVLINPNTKKQYDKFYKIITGDSADREFKRLVKTRLEYLTKWTEETEGIQNPDSLGTGRVGGENISSYSHLLSRINDRYISDTLSRSRTKSGISRWANWIIHVYSLLRILDDEVNGRDRATINTKRTPIDLSRLGTTYSNFKNAIWEKKDNDNVVDYYNRVRRKLNEVIHGRRSSNIYLYQDAQEENLEALRGMRGWDTFSGPENQQGTEKFHFVEGFSWGEKGIINLRFSDPNHQEYRQVINRAITFRDIKEKIAQESTKLDNLRDREGGGVSRFRFADLKKKLEKLGELKKLTSSDNTRETYQKTAAGKYNYNKDAVHGAQGRDYSFSYTRMKFNEPNSSLLQTKIDKIFAEFRAEIAEVGARPLNKAGSSGGEDNSELGKNVVREIESALRENGFDDLEAAKILQDNLWRNKLWFEYKDNEAKINSYREAWLGIIYRVAARRKIIEDLGIHSVSINQILEPSADGGDALKKHFKNFKDKASINAERNRLLALIRDYGLGRGEKIKEAIAAVKRSLRDNQLENDSIKIESILGRNWERQFSGLSNEASIDGIRDKFIRRIEDYVARDNSAIMAAIREIQSLLTLNNFSESILGPNWKDCFRGKSETEIIAELERLKRIIIAEGGKVPEIIASSKTASIDRIKNKLKEGHQKLVVREEELPSQLLAPYKTIEEKIGSFENLEDITAFENSLREAIIQKKQEKLSTIANEAIAEIRKEIGQDQIELGENRDYETNLRHMTDPDVIELVKKNIIKLIREQKASKENENLSESHDPNNFRFFSLKNLKIFGIVFLIILPLSLAIFFILRLKKRSGQRGIKKR